MVPIQNGTNPIAQIAIVTPTKAENGKAGAKNGKGKHDEKNPTVVNITADSTLSLFPPSASDFKRLDGEFSAVVAAIQLVEKPRREVAPDKKVARKAKAGARKQQEKAKPAKPAIQLLRLTFTLDEKRSDGMAYNVEKDILPKRDRESTFGAIIARILPDPEKFNRFFSDYKPVHLLNQRCVLKIKESRRQGQSTMRILEVLSGFSSPPMHPYSGESGHTTAGFIDGVPGAQTEAA